MCLDHQTYDSVLLTVSTVVEIGILALMISEGRKVVANVSQIYETTTTDYGHSHDLQVGERVFVQVPEPGVPREQWGYSTAVYVVREVDKARNRATATPVLPPQGVPTPTVSGPMNGPLSPFKKAGIAS